VPGFLWGVDGGVFLGQTVSYILLLPQIWEHAEFVMVCGGGGGGGCGGHCSSITRIPIKIG